MEANKNRLNEYFKGIGNLITKFRKEKEFTLEELGTLIGHDRSSMHRIEKGLPLTLKTIIKLSLALGKEPKDFLDVRFNIQPDELSGLNTEKIRTKKKSAKKSITGKKKISSKRK